MMMMMLYTQMILLSSLQQSVMASIIENNEQQQQQSLQSSSSSSSQQLQLLSPIFIDEPPARMLFSNSTGTVISCSATSSISPVKIWWINADNQAIVQEITGIRYVRPNGQLVFPPFALDQYRQDVHSTVSVYHCFFCIVLAIPFFSAHFARIHTHTHT